jgi:hypothetical protein
MKTEIKNTRNLPTDDLNINQATVAAAGLIVDSDLSRRSLARSSTRKLRKLA